MNKLIGAKILARVREWASSGNRPRTYKEVGWTPEWADITVVVDSTWIRLNEAGLTIARLADALDVVCEVAENSHVVIEQVLGSKVDVGQIEAVRKYYAELLGDACAKKSPVCNTCNDTHMMDLHDFTEGVRKVMCTRCPVPCRKCRAGGYGPFCAETPCTCDCHGERKS